MEGGALKRLSWGCIKWSAGPGQQRLSSFYLMLYSYIPSESHCESLLNVANLETVALWTEFWRITGRDSDCIGPCSAKCEGESAGREFPNKSVT